MPTTATPEVLPEIKQDSQTVAKAFQQVTQACAAPSAKRRASWITNEFTDADKPGERKTVSVRIDKSAFSFFDVDKTGWIAGKSDDKIRVGSSSRDLRLTGNSKLAEMVF